MFGGALGRGLRRNLKPTPLVGRVVGAALIVHLHQISKLLSLRRSLHIVIFYQPSSVYRAEVVEQGGWFLGRSRSRSILRRLHVASAFVHFALADVGQHQLLSRVMAALVE